MNKMPREISNKKLIIFYGMMKSGNHAIIKWVFENGLRQFLNNEDINKNPTKCCYNENTRIGDIISFYNDVILNPPPREHIIPTKITMVSMEDEYNELPVMKDVKFKEVYKVFIFRDIKNMIASRKKSKEYQSQNGKNYFGSTAEMCKRYDNLFNSYKKLKNGKNVILVSYDQLIKNGDSNLIETLDIPKKLKFNQIPRIISNNHKPGWSSFPGNVNFNNRKQYLENNDIKLIDRFLEQRKELDTFGI
jgi:hypothetical protein